MDLEELKKRKAHLAAQFPGAPDGLVERCVMAEKTLINKLDEVEALEKRVKELEGARN